MQVTETVNEGLKREFRVVVPASDLEQKVEKYLEDLKARVRLNGFRPGKVPVAHLRRLYGRAAMAEVIEETVRDANAKIVADHRLRLAAQPQVTLPEAQSALEEVMSGKADLAYTVSLELVPAITLADFKELTLERPVAEVTAAEVDEALQRIADNNKPYAAKGDGAPAATGDRVVIDYDGTIEGRPFTGGHGEDVAIVLGSGDFLPGFEDQLAGIATGESRRITLTFPQVYPNAELAGKEAVFQVTAKSVEAPQPVTIDDAFAAALGIESLEKLKDAIRARLQQEHAAASRRKVKRALLDELDKRHQFEAPPSLVAAEFGNIWETITRDLKERGRTFEDEGTTEEQARAEYRAIAERRVRLGLVLAEIGERNGIRVADEEVWRAVQERARSLPGREHAVIDFYRKNPDALASLRAPIFEDKVVDFLLELATVKDKPVSREELYAEDEKAEAA